MLALYSLIYALALAALFPFEYLKRPAGLRRRWLFEKLGSVRLQHGVGPASHGPVLWVHAVSVGEVIAAVPFIRAFKERHPEHSVMISTITDTGQRVAGERLNGLAEAIYLPFDMAVFFRRAVKRLKPSLFVVMETEIWPNMLRTMKEQGVPVVVLNGRISDSSFRGYLKIRFLMKRILGYVDRFCMQDDLYAERIIKLGAFENIVINTGSFKFDIKVKGEQIPWAKGLVGPVLIVGSTHRGEEALFLSVYKRLCSEFNGLNLILAPRHPERFDEVEELLKGQGVIYARRSRIAEAGHITGHVVLLDTVGELTSVYGVSDVAVIGGSFIEHGGQNPLEPAFFGKPVVCGPHMGNFPFIRDFYAEGAALEAHEESLYDILRELLSSPEKRSAMGKKAGAILERNRGAVERALGVVEQFAGSKP